MNTRTRHRWIGVTVLAACQGDAGSARTAAPPVATPLVDAAPLDAAPLVDAALVDAPLVDAALGPTAMVLTWRVETFDDIKQHVALIVTTGGHSTTYVLPDQFGAVDAINQDLCSGATAQYPKGPRDVAKIVFYEGGAGGYVVRRTRPTVLQVRKFSIIDGLCRARDGCHQPADRIVGSLRIGRGQPVVERIEQRDARGAYAPFDCGG